jgi:hypothetical protein
MASNTVSTASGGPSSAWAKRSSLNNSAPVMPSAALPSRARARMRSSSASASGSGKRFRLT